MDERAEQSGARHSLEVRARLGQPAPNALHAADAESATYERVEQGAAGDDVPADPRPRDVQLRQRLCLDERELVTAAWAAEGAAACRVTVALEPAPGDRDRRVDGNERCLRLRRDQQRGDDTRARLDTVRPLGVEPRIERRDEPALLDRTAGCD